MELLTNRAFLYLSVLLLALPVTAGATLGEPLESPTAGFSEKSFVSYRRSETNALNAPRMRQFAATTQGGKVFAVSWTGRLNDQINSLFGEYGTDLKKYDSEHPKRSGRIHYRKVDTGRVIFEFWDLPKMVKGRAYVPGLMPKDVTLDNID